MQIAFESYKNDGVSFTDWFSDNINMLLKIEKEQIVNAYRKGVINAEEHPEGEIINWEPYYKETYGE